MPDQSYFESFINNLRRSLPNLWFTEVNVRESGEYAKDPFVCAVKSDGGIFYILYAFDAANHLPDDFCNITETLIKKYNLRNTVVFSIMVADKVNEERREKLRRIADDSEEFYLQPVCGVNYLLNVSDNSLYTRANQSQDISGIKNMIEKCMKFYNGEFESGEPVTRNYAKPRASNEFFTYLIILICVLIFALMEMNGGSQDPNVLVRFGAIQSGQQSGGTDLYSLLTLITSMFVHIGWTHIMFNGAALLIFGTRAEKYYGKLNFLIIYFGSGIIGGIVSVLTTMDSFHTIIAGASGGIFGLLGSLLAFTQITKTRIDGLSSQSLIIYIIVVTAMGFFVPGTGNAAHIGGAVTGYLLGIPLSYRLRQT